MASLIQNAAIFLLIFSTVATLTERRKNDANNIFSSAFFCTLGLNRNSKQRHQKDWCNLCLEWGLPAVVVPSGEDVFKGIGPEVLLSSPREQGPFIRGFLNPPPPPTPCSSLQLSNEGKRNLLLLLKQIATTNFLLIRSFSQIRAKYVLGLEMQKFWQESSCRIRGQITKIFGFKIMEFAKYYVHYARMAPARGEMVRLKLPSYSQLISCFAFCEFYRGCC